MSESSSDAPFKVGDTVEVIITRPTTAEFWGQVVACYQVGTLDLTPDFEWRVDVRAIAPGFRRTIHVYPAAQLKRRYAESKIP